MCGIVYGDSFTGEPVNGYIMKQFKDQRHRGIDGFGVFDKDCNRLVRNTREKKIMRWLKHHPSKTLLFHHRLPTSTKNVKNACHPFSTGDFFETNYVLVHNGKISNAAALKKEHEKLGIVYTSTQDKGGFNDSEALLWDVALYLEGKQTELKVIGAIAFICMALPKDGRKHSKLHFARNYARPLNMLFDEEALLLSSEGAGEVVPEHTLHSYDYRTGAMKTKTLEVPTLSPASRGGNYRSRIPYSSYSDSAYQDAEYEAWKAEHYENADDYNWSNDDGTESVLSSMPVSYKTHTMKILPNYNEYSYTYANIITGAKAQPLLYYKDGDEHEIDVCLEVTLRCDTYLETADGNYLDAVCLLRDDMDSLLTQLDDDEALGISEDQDIVLELDLLLAARHTLYSSPHWANSRSIDPSWKSWNDQVKDAAATVLTHQAQLRLEANNG